MYGVTRIITADCSAGAAWPEKSITAQSGISAFTKTARSIPFMPGIITSVIRMSGGTVSRGRHCFFSVIGCTDCITLRAQNSGCVSAIIGFRRRLPEQYADVECLS